MSAAVISAVSMDAACMDAVGMDAANMDAAFSDAKKPTVVLCRTVMRKTNRHIYFTGKPEELLIQKCSVCCHFIMEDMPGFFFYFSGIIYDIIYQFFFN